MAEIESSLYVVDSNEEALNKILRLFECDNEHDLNDVTRSISKVSDAFKQYFSLTNYPELMPDDYEHEGGYIKVDFVRGSNGDDIIGCWVNFLTDISSTSIIHGWGSYDDDPYEFWFKGKEGEVRREECAPLQGTKSDRVILEGIYKWWHEEMPPGIKVGILGNNLKRPAKKKAKKSVYKKVKKKHKNLFEAYNERDYDYLSERITKRNLYQEDLSHLSLFKYSLMRQDRKLSQLLLGKGFDVQSEHGQTLLHWVAGYPYAGYENLHHSIPYLVELGMDVNRHSERDCTTPLMRAVDNRRHLIVAKLVECGADVNLLDCKDANALFYMCNKIHQDEIFDTLLEGGIDISQKNILNRTALFSVVWTQLSSVTKRLIELGADVNHQDISGQTPLFRCQWDHQMEVAKTCILNGADPFIKDNEGKRPIDIVRIKELIKNENLIELPDED